MGKTKLSGSANAPRDVKGRLGQSLRKALAVVMSAILVVGLWPGVAVADEQLEFDNAANLVASELSGIGEVDSDVDSTWMQSQSASTGDGRAITHISLGPNCSSAITSDGRLWAWGQSGRAYGSLTSNPTPMVIAENVLDAEFGNAEGWGTMAIIKDEFSLWTNYGSGFNDKVCHAWKDADFDFAVGDVAQFAIGDHIDAHSRYWNTAVVKTDGALWVAGFGYSVYDESDGSTTRFGSGSKPEKVMDDVVQVSLGSSGLIAAIKTDGTLWVWKYGEKTRLRNGTVVNNDEPVKVLDDVSIVTACKGVIAAIKKDGTLWMWGESLFGGVLGTGDGNDRSEPSQILENVVSVATNGYCTIACLSNGDVYVWGYNPNSTGTGTTYSNIPLKVDGIDNVVSVDVGSIVNSDNSFGHFAAVKKDGSLWMWGCNQYGELGFLTSKTASGTLPTCIFQDGVWLDGSGATKPSKLTDVGVSFKATVPDSVVTTKVQWDDAWFDNPSTTYNHELATTASVLACAAYIKEPGKDSNEPFKIEENFTNLGFEDFEYFNPQTKNGYADANGGYNQVAYAFATRYTNEGIPIIAMTVRGTPGNEEWLGNLNINDAYGTDTPYHQGFRWAALQQVVPALASYVEKKGIDPSKARYLITGHSRGAAVANLIAAYLDDGNAGASLDRVYAFTFASPTVSKGDDMASGRYGNIFNIVNPEDIVPQVPLSQWGFGRYGKTLVLPSRSNTFWPTYCSLRSGMNDLFREYAGKDYVSFKTGSLASWSMITCVRAGAGSVADFYNKKRMSLANVEGGSFQARMTMKDLFEALIRGFILGDKAQSLTLAYAATIPVFDAILLSAACPVLADGRWEIGDELSHMHTQETYVSWMQSADASLGELPAIFRSSYRGLKVACPVDVRVYDPSGNLAAAIVDDAVDESLLEEGLPAMVVDGVKYVDIPSDAQYRVEVTAREAGKMDFQVEERNGYDAQPESVKAYLGVTLEEGQGFTCESAEELAANDHVLLVDESETSAESVVSGSEVERVSVSVSSEGDGDVWGATDAIVGEEVTVHALPADGNRFAGWYLDGQKVSENEDYSFRATSAVELIAQFEEITLPLPEGSQLVTSVDIEESEIELYVGEEQFLYRSVLPKDAVYKKLKWESSNPEVATCDEAGVVTAVSPGTAQVTASALDGSECSDSVTVVVAGIPAAVEAVIQAIAALPELDDLKLTDEEAVSEARAAYDDLTTENQELVDNYNALLAAEAQIEALKEAAQEEADRAAAAEVEGIIEGLVDLTLSDADRVAAAAEAYDALTGRQQGYVSNVDKLREAQATIQALQEEAAQEESARAGAAPVVQMIAALPELDALQLTDEGAIAAAQAAFDALTAAEQMYVDNYDVLQEAEARIAELKRSSNPGTRSLADAEVQWGSPLVYYNEGGLPDVSGVVRAVLVDGETLAVGGDYQLVVVNAQGEPVDSVPASDGKYYVLIEGLGDYAGTHCQNDIPLTVLDPYYIGTALGVSGWWNAYTGSAHQVPNPAAYGNAGPLWLGTDYDAEFLDSNDQPIQPVEPGTYRLVFTGKGQYHGTYEATYTIADKNDLAYASVIVNRVINGVGKAVNPVTVSVGGVPLVAGEDYSISYTDRDGTTLSEISDPGAYSFVITAGPNGKYKGTYTGYDTITISTLNESDLSNAVVYVDGMALKVGATTTIYAGEDGVVPEVVVKMGATTLREGVDYEFAGWTNYGSETTATKLVPASAVYSFTVTAKDGGGYTGSFKGDVSVRSSTALENAKVTVSNADNYTTSQVPVFAHTGSPIDVQVDARIDGKQVDSSNYKLIFAKCEFTGDNWSVLNSATVSVVGDFTEDAPLEPGVYCLRLQATGEQYSGSWWTNPGNWMPQYLWVGDYYDVRFATIYTYTSVPYANMPVHPGLKLLHNGKLLTEGEDFEITGYTQDGANGTVEPIEPGTYYASIKGIGRYSGESSVPFEVIEPVLGNISNADIEYDRAIPYTGSAAYPALNVSLDGDPLVLNEDYTIESVDSVNAKNVEPVTIGSYYMTLRGVDERGVSGTRVVSYSIVNSQSLSGATVEGIEQYYQHTGTAVNPKPTKVRMGDTELTEGKDYEVEYYRWEEIESRDGSVFQRQVLTSSCADEGRYEMHIVGYGAYSGYAAKSFAVLEPGHNLSEATVYVVRDGERVPLAASYEYTGEDVLGEEFEVWLGGVELDPADYIIRINNGGYVLDPVYPGKYYLSVVPTSNVFPQTGRFSFDITVPTRTQNGVEAAGELFVDKADEEAGTEVQLTVEGKGDDAAPATKRVVESCEAAVADDAYVGVTDVRLDVVKSGTNEVVESITEDFGELKLTFPVDAKYNGTAARIIQVHEDEDTGVVRTIEHPLARVVDGHVSVTVDRLSEFVVVAGQSAAALDVNPIRSIAKPTATDFTFDGEGHTGVAAGAGYELSGTPTATAVGTYTVTATLAEEGYEWEDGTTAPIELNWKIINASSSDPIDLSGASLTLSSTSYTYDGSAKEPTVTVSVNGATVPSSAYSVSYEGNVNAGTATATISAKTDGYEGEASAQFTIAKRNATIAAKSATKVYDGTALKASVVGYETDGFVNASDLASVTMAGSITDAGSVDSFIGSYSLAPGMDRNYDVTLLLGTLGVTPADITSAMVTLSQSAYTYDGTAKSPVVTVKSPNGAVLQRGSDYTLIVPAGRTAVGTYTYSISGKGNYTGLTIASFTIAGPSQPAVEPVVESETEPTTEPTTEHDALIAGIDVYRLYNPNNGDHHYTTSANERDVLSSIGWDDEGIAWIAPSTSSTPVYRLYNPYSGDHHYTMSINERDSLDVIGWDYEGVAWYSDDMHEVALYRLYNQWLTAGTHHYTTSVNERDSLSSMGWEYEGVAWYGMG